MCWTARDRPTRPLPITRRPWKSSPNTPKLHVNLANRLARRGQFDEAIAHYRKALEINPNVAEFHYNLGDTLANRGQVDEAIAHYRKALEIKPNYVEAHNNLGIALADRGQIDEAITHYRKALEIKPDYVNAYIGLGDALAGRGRRREAIEYFQKALDLASARNDKTMADVIRARIKRHQEVAPAGNAVRAHSRQRLTGPPFLPSRFPRHCREISYNRGFAIVAGS